MVAPFMPEDEKLRAVREALPAVNAGIYVNTATAGPLPAETDRAMADVAAIELRTGRAHPAWLDEGVDRIDEARAAVAAILTADVGDVALTHSTTDGLNLAAWGAADWTVGGRIVTTRDEDPGTLAALRALRDRFGVELVALEMPAEAGHGERGVGGGDRDGDVADATSDQADDAVVSSFEAAIAPGAALVAFSHVVGATGRRMPVERIAALARGRGATVVVDGAQAAGAIAVDVGALGVDAYALDAHRWLLGPQGMGALYVAPEFRARARPTAGGRLALDETPGADTPPWHTDARRYQVTRFHRPSVVGMARSLGWLSMYVGLDWVHRRTAVLAAAAIRRLAAIDGVRVVTPERAHAGIVTFRIRGWTAEDAVEELGARVFAIAAPIPALDGVRISPGFFNTEAEIDRFAAGVSLLAAHTRETLPPRRLTVLGSDR